MKTIPYWLRDFLEFFVPVAILLVVGGGALIALICGWDYLDCKGFKNGTGYETRWWWGCYAKVDGEWMPKEYVFGKVNELRVKDKRDKR